jgi:hypothetical protein
MSREDDRHESLERQMENLLGDLEKLIPFF